MSDSFVDDHIPLFASEPKKDCYVSVVIPVKDEGENIESTLFTLANQLTLDRRPLAKNSFEILILANNCIDNSAEIIKFWQRKNSVVTVHLTEANLPSEKANIGYVRRQLMNEAYLRLCRNRCKNGVIMTTDGDTCPAPNWIAANLKEIELGAEAVGGRISIKPEDLRRMNEKARRFHLFDTGYRLAAAEIEARLDQVSHDLAPRHHQHFNGSFAVTTEAFRRAGGVPKVRYLEDVAFYNALLRVDAKIHHSPRVRVQTSSRLAGRTECGLSSQINEWTLMGENGDVYLVESAVALIQRIVWRKSLRDIWRTTEKPFKEINLLAENLFVSSNFLVNELGKTQTFGVLLEKVSAAQHENGEWAQKFPLVCVTRALADLRQILVPLRQKNQSKLAAFSQTSSR